MPFELRQQLRRRRANGEWNLNMDGGRIVRSSMESGNSDSFLNDRSSYIVPNISIA